MTVWKWAVRGLGLAGLLCGILLAVLLVWVDPNDFKPQIVSAVREATGRELTLSGDLKLAFFPYLSVSTGSIELGNSPGFEGPFLTLRRAHLKARLLPLLLARLEVVAVDVEGLALFLERDANGRGNWMDLATAPGDGGTQDAKPVLATDKRVPAVASLIVDGLEISDTRVVWTDRMSGQKYDVSGIRLDVSNFAFGEPFDVATGAQALFGGLKGELDITTRAVLDLDRLTVEDLAMSARLEGDALPQKIETVTLTADRVSTDGRIENGRMQGFGLDMSFGMRTTPDAATNGTIAVSSFVPREAARRLGLALPDFVSPSSLERSAFSCSWARRGDRLDVSGLNLALDNSTLSGTLSVHGLEKKPALVFDLSVDTLDLDRYLPHGKPSGTKANGSGASTEGLPVEALRRLDLEGVLSAGSLTVAKLNFTGVRAALRARDGMLTLQRLDTNAYGGKVSATGSMDVQRDQPRYTWTHTAAGLQVGPLLKALHGREALSGTMRSSGSLQARGAGADAIKRSLEGTLDFKVTNGAIHGVNIAQQLRDGIRQLKGQQPGPAEPDRTDFSVLSASGVIAGGIEKTPDLLLLAPRFRITGSGQADLVQESLDCRLMVFLEGSEGKFEEGTLGLSSVPVRVSGPLREPTVAPDMAAVVKGLGLPAGQAVQDTLKGVGSGLNKGVEGLKRLFQ